MAIFYCDFYNGSDSNNGTSSSTPKLSLSATTSLTTTATDEIRVRGYDNLSTNVGNIYWVNGSLSLTGSTDLTGSLSVGSYIYKSTDTIPDIYKIQSLSFTGGVMSITLVISNGYYEGSNELCGVMKINLPGSQHTIQSCGIQGRYSGTESNCFARTGNTISGGWDSTFTTRTGYTMLYNTGNSTIFNSHNYWDISYFMVIGGGSLGFGNVQFSNPHHLVSSDCVGNYFYAYMYISDCVFNNQKTNGRNDIDLSTIYNVISRGGSINFYRGTYNAFVYNSVMTNATSACVQYINSITNSYLTMNNSTGTIFYGINMAKNNTFKIYNSNVKLYDYCVGEFINNKNVGSIVGKVNSSNGMFINSEYMNVSLPGLTTQIPYLEVYNGDSDFNNFTLPTTKLISVSCGYYHQAAIFNSEFDTGQITWYYNIPISFKNPENNIILYDTCSVQTTGITYSGTTGLKLKQYSSSFEAVAGTFDFYVITGLTYNYNFYIKSSNSQSFSYNWFNNKNNLYSTWITGTTSSSTWTNITGSINQSLIVNGGILRLFIKFNSGTKHSVYISDVSLT